ncbi:hypothetical protein AMK16_32935 [Streptomyces sp. CB00455]|uniref:hypothetical protein n=1 Tax=Streptomyces sp. CB00455 TaxID=1703927 RepID=UPI00093B2BD9|nr:hypothetical protein [Streptomyces sp. CB00455]OKK11118.1 hypothetical protein AMK16_32935 [Streptomyces sp. CB00455]
MGNRSNVPTARAPGGRLPAPGDGASTLARAEHGLVAFIARRDDLDETTVADGEDAPLGER